MVIFSQHLWKDFDLIYQVEGVACAILGQVCVKYGFIDSNDIKGNIMGLLDLKNNFAFLSV